MLRNAVCAVLAATLAACGGGGAAVSTSGTNPVAADCTGSCFTSPTALTASDVEVIIAQAVAEARARKVTATIAVVDRVGNVLAVYRMGAPVIPQVLISSSVNAAGNPLLHTGLDGIRLPVPGSPGLGQAHLDDQAAIAKASGRRPTVVGKPSRAAVRAVAERLALDPRRVAFVGDDLAMDIALGRRAGGPTVLVRSGMSAGEGLGEHAADLVVDAVADLLPLI